ncbi:hypothetical protein SPRG_01936 [Saprolegnia parasitica CBS 223.65]|uniref:Uncharacterized protein n=1 Tax=Saprolegnia parasitica (strain CBS 223.65) TaxID=695850 RepID=A0A067CQZ6_SAPPC|nr:hypothetical protein SPRG_01936 [Saprolegnia parasitica CBS 223.65]KDO33124.1 hypothetical protein SPRG_01936 [Saprolegnia parasitica CBS 223.65]|eukprot:XP_012195891.1 hypothetical protein SPRG_01936 [Saprolegnia parasitica CBS 223.65]
MEDALEKAKQRSEDVTHKFLQTKDGAAKVLKHFFGWDHATADVEDEAPIELDMVPMEPTMALQTMLMRAAAIVQAPPVLLPQSMADVVYEATLQQLGDLQFRVFAMNACKSYIEQRHCLVREYWAKLAQPPTPPTAEHHASLQSTFKMLVPIYRNDVKILRRNVKQYEAAASSALALKYKRYPNDHAMAVDEHELRREAAETSSRLLADFPETILSLEALEAHDATLLEHHVFELEYMVAHARICGAFYVTKAKHRADAVTTPLTDTRSADDLQRAFTDALSAYEASAAALQASLAADTQFQLEQQARAAPSIFVASAHSVLYGKLQRAARKVRAECRLSKTLHQLVSLAQAHTQVASIVASDAVHAAVAAAVVQASAALTSTHEAQIHEAVEAHARELEALEHPHTTLDKSMDVADVKSAHKAELFAIVSLTKVVARRKALALRRHAEAEFARLEHMQAQHAVMLQKLEAELETRESLEHMRLLARLEKRKLARMACGSPATTTSDPLPAATAMLEEEKAKIIEEKKSEWHEAEVACANDVQAAAVKAIAAEAVTFGLGPDTDVIQGLIAQLQAVDFSRAPCTIKQIHAVEKVLLSMRESAQKPRRSGAKTTAAPRPSHIVVEKAKKTTFR